MCLLLASGAPALAQITRTQVAEGALAGKPLGAVTAYLGMPYAAPPIGNDRWRPPRPAASWTGERASTKFAASCQQTLTPNGFGPWTPEYVVQGETSEDCLYINVWTPARDTRERRPVLVWIYGGGFSSGSGSVPIYDGAALAAKGVVVVSFNYRVGVYGFLAHPELTAESPASASGNYGLLDQLAALRWVKANISAFGGDPARVTIAGQSAGAASVHALIASPLAKGLFAQAIAQSGSGMGLPTPARDVAETVGRSLSNLGNDVLTLTQLRALKASGLDARVARMPAGAVLGLRFGPCVDGLFFPDANSVGKNTNDTPILTGITANEVSGLDPKYGTTTLAAFNAQLTDAYRGFAPQISSLYPASSDHDATVQFDAHARDRGLASMYRWAANRFTHTKYPIYAYLWTHAEPGPEASRYKAFHSSEIPYVFNTLKTSQRPFTTVDHAIAARMSSYWINFISTGNPNDEALPRWPALDQGGKQIMELGVEARPRPILTPDRLQAFERYANSGGHLGIF